ncbi:hypothetical protein CL633_01895 [bacterium]|nr:hypothetical protein [bacterium]|tara:strand:- start:10093 stop:10362 length:270 start_codon:yes stop_codon:yes gene_type:complete
MNKIRFSSHALKRMQERNVSRYIVISSLNNPDIIEISNHAPNRFLAKKRYFNQYFSKEHLLIIVFEINKNIIEIITIIDTSKINKYLNL